MKSDPTDVALMTAHLTNIVSEAHDREGGRHYCCGRTSCAMHLAEDRLERRKVSTIHCGHSIAQFPDTPDQELAASAAKTQYLIGLRILGLDRDFAA
jgi:hypothetical protein